jgi:P4 family phage/plasmid primase-like protien
MKIAFQLQNSGYLDSIVKIATIDFTKSKFFETKIDSKGFLFAFKNKLLDCRSLEIRNIRPDDYIMTNTGYDYPEFIDEDYVKKFNKYFETIYYNKDVCEYMWDNYALLLNGEREFQTFNIHTGKGSNSKSTFFSVTKMSLGDYFCKINADTFTKQSRSANSTSELYKTKGTRLVFFNEPTDDDENKLQVSLLKELADGFKSTLKTRALYKESIEFPIFFRVEGCCNNKPTLSSADGGISRRVRVIDYPIIFKQNADPNNPLEVELDLQMGSILTTNEMRDTFIKLLIDRFINISSKLTKENIPKQIQEASLDYVADSNPVLAFITEKYIITKNNKDRISSSDLFTDFKLSNGSKLSDKKFKDYLTNISGIEHKKSNGYMYYTGLIEKMSLLKTIEPFQSFLGNQ